MGGMVALLRAVNVGGRKLPMSGLRTLCADLGWRGVATYIQSGNIVFSASGKPAALEAQLEKAIAESFGITVPVIVRSAAQWSKLAASNPFARAGREAPSRLQLFVSKQAQARNSAEKLSERAHAREEVKAVSGGLWLHFPEGIARSKLTPSLIDKACGSPTSGRNYRTVMKIKEMLEA